MAGTIFPSVDELIETNKRVLREIRVKKADRHRMLSRASLEAALQRVKAEEGDVYDKAAILLTEMS
jgi:prophage maintenance system killer protein